MPSEWLGVHGGRSYGPVPRGSFTLGPAVGGYVRRGGANVDASRTSFTTSY